MGAVSLFYIAFASISLFACVLQLFISYRKSRDLLFMVSSILSCLMFIYFTALVLCTKPLGFSCPPLTMLKYQLIISQIVLISMFGVLYHLVKSIGKIHALTMVSILGLLTLMTLFIPEQILFGVNTTIKYLALPYGDKIPILGTGFTFWRIIKDLTVIIFIVFSFVLLVKKLNDVSFITIAILFAGLGIVLLTAIYDQLIDLGLFSTIYFLPYAFFVFFIVLTFIPFIFFIEEAIKLQKIIQQEKRLQYLVNQSDIIVVGLNRMGIVETASPFFYALTGYKEEEVIGNDWFEFFIPPKEYYNVQGAFVEILEYAFHPQYLNPILTKNKEEKLIRWFNVRIHDQQGKISGSLSIGIDVTSDNQENAELQKKLMDAEQLIAKLQQDTKNFE